MANFQSLAHSTLVHLGFCRNKAKQSWILVLSLNLEFDNQR